VDDFSYFRWVVFPALVVLGRLAWVRWRAREAGSDLAARIERQVKKISPDRKYKRLWDEGEDWIGEPSTMSPDECLRAARKWSDYKATHTEMAPPVPPRSEWPKVYFVDVHDDDRKKKEGE